MFTIKCYRYKMAPRLYMISYSQPVRATLMTITALNLDVELVEVDLLHKEQLKSDFIKINPQHTVPTLVEDDGFVLWDSHSIMSYLVDKYAENDSLYPRDLRKRAVVNQRLHFDSGVLFPLEVVGPVIYDNEKTIPPQKVERVMEAYRVLEIFLEGQDWVAGTDATIADFSILSSITTLNIVVPIDGGTFPNIASWLKRAESQPFYEANKQGLDTIGKLVTEKMH